MWVIRVVDEPWRVVGHAIDNFFNNGGALPPAFVSLFNFTGNSLTTALDHYSNAVLALRGRVAWTHDLGQRSNALPDDVRVVLQLDGVAERERHRRTSARPVKQNCAA